MNKQTTFSISDKHEFACLYTQLVSNTDAEKSPSYKPQAQLLNNWTQSMYV